MGIGVFWMSVMKLGGSLAIVSCAVAGLIGCGEKEVTGPFGSTCAIEKEEDEGIKFVCADGSVYHWSNQSEAAVYCHVEETESGAKILCPDGSVAEVNDGRDGTSCSANEVDDGVVLQCGEEDWTLVRHGRDGEDAPASAFMIKDIIDPCGSESAFDEVLLVFANGDILAHYAAGAKQHFSFIGPGNYITTDGTRCVFSVSEGGEVTW